MKRLGCNDLDPVTGAFPAPAFSALVTCSSIPRRVRRARSWRYWQQMT
jgi:hypothetical protein